MTQIEEKELLVQQGGNSVALKGRLCDIISLNHMQEKIHNLIKESLKKFKIAGSGFSVEHPADFKMGDYSTNVAMVYAKHLKKNPRELAEEIVKNIKDKEIEKIEVAGPGFINFYLSKDFFTNEVKNILKQKDKWGSNKILKGKKVMVEYTQPNPFKPFHIGHLMSNAIGESISRIVEFSGAKTIRANYQGDVGPHVAKAIYGLMKTNNINSTRDKSQTISVRAFWIGTAYVNGSNAYENNEDAKKEIDEINQKVYDRSDKEINKIYDEGREITLAAFEELYKTLGTKFDYYFFESEMAVKGEKIVRKNIGKVFEESDPTPEQAKNGQGGAIVFHGEKHDPKLHTRVFINSKGLPTYETKEIGLTMTKFKKENPDISIVTTAIEQAEYMKVVQKAISIIHPEMEKKMKHITHGMMRLAEGKMSSRKGNVITGESLISDSIRVIRQKIVDKEFTEKERINISRQVGISALKYSILRSSIGSDIVYDFEKSISFDGDSGPYLQYTAVRANSILEKAKKFKLTKDNKQQPTEVTDLEKMLYQFPEIVEHSYDLLEPHHITTYLTELASAFNGFYNSTPILKEDNKYISFCESIT